MIWFDSGGFHIVFIVYCWYSKNSWITFYFIMDLDRALVNLGSWSRWQSLWYFIEATFGGFIASWHMLSIVFLGELILHYSDVIMSAIASQITGGSVVCSTVCSGADQRRHQSSVSLAFVRRIHRWPVDSTDKGAVTRKMLPFNDVILTLLKRC